MMGGIQNLIRGEAQRAGSSRASVRLGTVTAYHAENHSAKARIEPEGHETGWLPVATPWSGDGWGLFCPPTPGDVVDVHFQEGGKEAGFVALRHFGDRFRPLPVPSGEFWLVHKSGSSMKFLNDGTVELHAATAINTSAPAWNHEGKINATDFHSKDIPCVPDGWYRTGLGLSQDGYIATVGGIIVDIQEAT